MRYSDSQQKIFSVFGSQAWVNQDIITVPQDVVPLDTTNEYVRISIVPSGQGINLISLSGICIIDIFTAFGEGPSRANEIADKLDVFLMGITIEGVVQFGQSTLLPKGRDKDTPSQARYSYTIPFNYFGVN